MKLSKLIENFPVKVATQHEIIPDYDITGGISSDLLSYVMANAKEGNIWITIQTHQNIVAVASLTNLAAIIIVGGAQPDQDTLSRASQEDIPILTTDLPAYEFILRMAAFGKDNA
jgi:predicted transcriptional regulator